MTGIKRGGRDDVRWVSKRGGDFVIRTDDLPDHPDADHPVYARAGVNHYRNDKT